MKRKCYRTYLVSETKYIEGWHRYMIYVIIIFPFDSTSVTPPPSLHSTFSFLILSLTLSPIYSSCNQRVGPKPFLVLKRAFLSPSDWSLPSDTEDEEPSLLLHGYSGRSWSVSLPSGWNFCLHWARPITHRKHERLASWYSGKETGSQGQCVVGPALSLAICLCLDQTGPNGDL